MPAIAAPTAEAWSSYRGELVRFVQRRVGDAAAADDIVHDALLKALSRLESLADPAKLRGWLYRIARNAIVDHYRARRPAAPLPEELRDEAPAQLAHAEQELAQCLTPLLGALPAPYREALALAEIEGLTQGEIARRVGLSLSGAKSRVQRARAMLRAALLACCRVELDRRGGVTSYEPRAGCEPCDGAPPTGCGDAGGPPVARGAARPSRAAQPALTPAAPVPAARARRAAPAARRWARGRE